MRDESIDPGLVLPFGNGATAQLGTGSADLEEVQCKSVKTRGFD